ncbi:hypothetical protein RRG08_064845 [Elysia crispata]|uniref:Uncharacterized protein n=1 Tax=Elysia crispata TaxID=231223 RepID=A0AAE1E3H1_9GAST|nr:hypothetical protein RRG08_064845 [Elysia crispata]
MTTCVMDWHYTTLPNVSYSENHNICKKTESLNKTNRTGIDDHRAVNDGADKRGIGVRDKIINLRDKTPRHTEQGGRDTDIEGARAGETECQLRGLRELRERRRSPQQIHNTTALSSCLPPT